MAIEDWFAVAVGADSVALDFEPECLVFATPLVVVDAAPLVLVDAAAFVLVDAAFLVVAVVLSVVLETVSLVLPLCAVVVFVAVVRSVVCSRASRTTRCSLGGIRAARTTKPGTR